MSEDSQKERNKASPIPNRRLRSARELRGWSRDYVAEKTGSDSHTIGRWERGVTSPNPYYRQSLCELFGMNAEELGLIKEDVKDTAELPGIQEAQQTEATNIVITQHWPVAHNSSHIKIGYRGLLGIIIATGAIIGLTALLLSLFSWKFFTLSPTISVPSTSPSSLSPTSTPHLTKIIVPGGVWVNPTDRQIVHDILHFAARAYPTNFGDPPIDHVNFTITWPGSHWQVACQASSPAAANTFACNTNLHTLGVLYGQVTVSFDVYDLAGDINKSPNGERTITYSPSH